MFTSVRFEYLLSSSVIALVAAVGTAAAQQTPQPPPAATPAQPPAAATSPAAATPPGAIPLPEVTVTAPRQTTPRRTATRPAAPRPATVPRPAAPAPTPAELQLQANQQVVRQTTTLDTRRDEALQPKVGTNLSTMTARDIENAPQGANISISDLVYQFPGVSQDSTSSGDFHVRNDHANVQFRINGIQMPDGVSGFSQFLETGLFSKFSLITGALPAQYGLHTTGVLDITTKSGNALSGGSVSVYGGSFGTLSPSFEYGGVKGNTEYFATGRFFTSNLGLENPTSATSAIHDHTDLGRFFSYTSTLLDPNTRFVTFAGVSEQAYQIPTNPGQQPNTGGFFGSSQNNCGMPTCPYQAFGVQNLSSSAINQNQYEKNEFFVAAWQRSLGDVDAQVSYYNRYSELHFVPDPVGDLLFNNIATDVLRRTFVNGVQGDFAYRLNDTHTLRAGFITQSEQSKVATVSTVERLDGIGNAIDQPFNITDSDSKLGWQLGLYLQDEWKLAPTLTLNYGARFDQMWQYVNANQVSPRASLQWQPWWATVLHAGYARNFTPPDQVLGRLTQPQLLNGTTGTVPVANVGSILPERSDVYDVGIVQQLLPKCPTSGSTPAARSDCPTLEVGVDAYYKWARDLIDDGQFGQAYLLSAFNYEKGMVKGIEFKAKYAQGNFTLYTNWALGWEKAINPVSNQSFFDPSTLAYLQNNWIYTDHTQLLTGSAGASYLFADTGNWWLDGSKVSATMIYGSGLRTDGAQVVAPDGNLIAAPNGGHVPAYTQVNLGLSKEFKDTGWDPQPFTVRFDIVNLFDSTYVIRDGGGIGVFAPQFGPRRGYFVGFSQKLGAPAYATDLSVKAPPRAINNWTGLYGGANFGGVFSTEHIATPLGTASSDPGGPLGGVQLGYNFQLAPSWLVGIEAESDWAWARGTANVIGTGAQAGTALSLAVDNHWYGTVSGRLGYVAGPWLLFAKGGAAWMNGGYQLEVNSGLAGASSADSVRTGWNGGVGVEYLLTPQWSVKAEYDHLDFGSRTFDFNTPVTGGTTFRTQVEEIKAGVNYHFTGL